MSGGPGITLRPMRWWDIEPVLELERVLFPEDAWSAGMFWSELADARHPGATRHYTVAEDAEGRVVGYAGLMAVSGEGDVQTIAVARGRWGGGLGSRLLAELVREAGEQGCADLLLEVRVDNVRAQRLYERFGFQPIGVRRNYYQPSGVDALVMRLADPARAPLPEPMAATAAPVDQGKTLHG
ncbi:ribosomal protein S18-alanine N-acetyltransferase [Peterkaempfera griseoplana]|uniref:ribosomal protein S18-alanine N-acetyltransferase n=1 Tax=Peterkaempfera griseoplana TaxID=66896 RepID=UPI000A6C209E|nr:ribosomal protein S18-alanine N-acetyltransferase [Peterkaempfera griseoplana]